MLKQSLLDQICKQNLCTDEGINLIVSCNDTIIKALLLTLYMHTWLRHRESKDYQQFNVPQSSAQFFILWLHVPTLSSIPILTDSDTSVYLDLVLLISAVYDLHMDPIHHSQIGSQDLYHQETHNFPKNLEKYISAAIFSLRSSIRYQQSRIAIIIIIPQSIV